MEERRLTAEQMNEVILDVVLGRRAKLCTPEARRFRREVERDVRRARDRGQTVVPSKDR